MITVDELMARMRNGESTDSIADELAKMLNMAEKAIAEEQTKSKNEKWFYEACAAAADAMNLALEAYADWQGLSFPASMEMDEDSIVEVVKAYFGLDKFMNIINDTIKNKPRNNHEIGINTNDKDFDTAVNDFLRKYDLL